MALHFHTWIRVTAVITLLCFIATLIGCHSDYVVKPGEIEHGERGILRAVTNDGEVIEFQKVGGEYAAAKDSMLIGFREAKSRFVKIPVSQITRIVQADDAAPGSNEIARVVTREGKTVSFEKVGGHYAVRVDSIVAGYREPVELVKVPLSQLESVTVSRLDGGKTAAFVILGVPLMLVGVVLIIAALKGSCPFLYSWDGERYAFDGEPYGGAICEGLKRTDMCRLDHLKPAGGAYRLKLTNEVNETQFTDRLTLVVADHPAGTRIATDFEGNLYTLAGEVAPLSARGPGGRQLTERFRAADGVTWESNLRAKSPDDPSCFRDTLVITFPRPEGTRHARLVVAGGTTLWGSHMLRSMTAVRGEQIPEWYEQLKSPVVRQMVDQWDKREGLYHIQFEVLTRAGWQGRGYIAGGGPFVAEQRVVPFDLQGVEGDSVTIRLAPAAGFWQFDAFAIDYAEAPAPSAITEVSAATALSDGGEDVRELLAVEDGRYYSMPRTGQEAMLTFPTPPLPAGLERTVFARVSGYYDLHLPAMGAPQLETMNRIAFEPGYPVQFSLREYGALVASKENGR